MMMSELPDLFLKEVGKILSELWPLFKEKEYHPYGQAYNWGKCFTIAFAINNWGLVATKPVFGGF